MLDDEVDRLKNWVTAPFTTNIPMWQMFIVVAVFSVITYVVWDNLDLLKKGLS